MTTVLRALLALLVLTSGAARLCSQQALAPLASLPQGTRSTVTDDQGATYAAGETHAFDLPVRNAVQSRLLGPADAFVSKVSPSGEVVWATYLGGSGVDEATSIRLDANGTLIVRGTTNSHDLPRSTNCEVAGEFTARFDLDGHLLGITCGPEATPKATARRLAGSTASSVNLTSSPAPSSFGANVTLTATVTPAGATGKVMFFDGVAILGVGTVSSGTATFSTTLLPAGARSLTARYTGDTTYAVSTSSVRSHTVNTSAVTSFNAQVAVSGIIGPQNPVIADYNRDGRPDFTVVRTADNTFQSFLGAAGGTFTPLPDRLAGASAYSVIPADFNGDGRPDVAVLNAGGGTVSIFLTNADNSVTQAAGSPYTTGFLSQFGVAGDFNGDGFADLAIVHLPSSLTVLLGNGAGGFTPAAGSPFSTGAMAYDITLADFNGDGKADLGLAHSVANSVSIMLGDGSGAFALASGSPLAIGTSPVRVLGRDLNGDGLADLLVSTQTLQSVSLYPGNGSGGLGTAVVIALPASTPRSLATTDFNGDGRADFAVGLLNGTVAIYLANGSGGFVAASGSPFAAGGNAAGMAIADFNGDGAPDILMAQFDNDKIVALMSVGLSTVTVSASANPVFLSTSVTLTATVSPIAATGTVAFYDGANILGYGTLSNGTATLATSSLPSGIRRITVRYLGNANYQPGISSALNLAINSRTASGAGRRTILPSSIAGSTAVATADLNNDGIRDLVVANRNANTVSVYLGDNLWLAPTLAPGSPLTVGAGPGGFAVGDFNKDGKQDVVCVNTAAGTVQILYGLGNGQLSPADPIAVPGSPQNAVVADFNGDGNLDFSVVSFGNSSVYTFLGAGNGNFTAAPNSPTAVGPSPWSVSTADLNNDGKPDLVTANGAGGNVSLLFGDGAGRFTAQTPLAAGGSPRQVAIGDINNDGSPDLAIASYNNNSLTIYLNNGSGGFTQTWIGNDDHARSVGIADFNGDGFPDFAVAGDHVSGNFGIIRIYLGNGQGQVGVIPVTVWFSSEQGFGELSGQALTIADMNADGRPDIVLPITGPRTLEFVQMGGAASSTALAVSPSTAILSSQITLTATVTPATATGSMIFYDGVKMLGIAQVSGGTATLTTKTLPSGARKITARFKGDPSSNAGSVSTAQTVTISSLPGYVNAGLVYPFSVASPYAVAMADFNNDGRMDLLYASNSANTVTLLRQLAPVAGGLRFADPVVFPVGTQPNELVTGDFNLDGITDFAVANRASNNITVVLLNSSQAALQTLTYATGNGAMGITSADFNRDGIPDLAVANYSSDTVTILLGTGTGTFQTAANLSGGQHPHSVVTADFNQDGNADLAVTNYGSSDVSIFLGNGLGAFSQAPYSPLGAGSGPSRLAVGDLNGDGKPDLVVPNVDSNYLTMMLSNGAAGFTVYSENFKTNDWTLYDPDRGAGSASKVVNSMTVSAVAIEDFDGDGKQDIAFQAFFRFCDDVSGWLGCTFTTNDRYSTIFGRGDGTGDFELMQQVATGYIDSKGFVAGDVDGDGRPDVFQAGNLENKASVLLLSAARLKVTRTHSGNPTQGQNNVAFTITVKNEGNNGTNNTITVTDTLPAGLTLVSMSGSGWNCSGSSCSRSDALAAGASFPAITATVNVAISAAASSLVTRSTVSGPLVNTDSVADPVTVTPTASVLVFSSFPNSPPGIGSTVPAIQVQVLDGTGAQVVTTSTAAITLNITGGAPSSGTTTVNAVNGVATFSNLVFNTGGTRQISATSPGIPVNTGLRNLSIEGYGTSVALAVSPSGPSIYGQAVKLTATVTSPTGGAVPAAKVTFYDGITILGSTTTSNGVATLTTRQLASGARSLRALYAGLPNPPNSYARSSSSSVALQVNAMPGTGFTAIGNLSSPGTPWNSVTGDVNNDGCQDIVTGNTGGSTISVYLGNCAGGFTQASGSPFSAGTGPNAVLIGDFDMDGKQDIIAACYGEAKVRLFTGNGNGTFTPWVLGPIAVGLNPVAMAVSDFNGDGTPDIAVANNSDNTVTIILNGGQGILFPSGAGPISVGAGPRDIVAGDFNGDGKTDLAVANYTAGTISVLLGGGGSDFTQASGSPFLAGATPWSLAVADINNDGKPDLLAANYTTAFVGGFLGNGSGGFTPATLPPAASYGANGVGLADFNGDGKLDLAVGSTANGNVSVFSGNNTGVFTAISGSPFAAGSATKNIAFADFNGDGRVDIVAPNANSGNVTVLIASGVASSTTLASSPNPSTYGASVTVTATIAPAGTVGTVTFYDGATILGTAAVAGGTTATLSVSLLAPGPHAFKAVYASTGTTTSSTSATLTHTVNATAAGGFVASNPAGSAANSGLVTVADVNLDGKADVIAIKGDSQVSVWLGNGSLGFTQAPGSPMNTGANPGNIAVADFNGDGVPDIAISHYGDDYVSIRLGNGNGSFTESAGSPASGSNPHFVASGDFNGDGKADIAVANFGSASVRVLLGDGAGGFTNASGSPFSVGANPWSVAVGDFNGDGKLDLAVPNGGSGNVTILLGAGNGSFTAAAAVTVGSSPRSIAIADYNADGKLDLAVTNYNDNTVSIRLGNGLGGFTSAADVTLPAGTNPWTIVATDINADGKQDLAVAGYSSGNVGFFLGAGNGTFSGATFTPIAVAGNPAGLALGEFNGDGRVDFIAGSPSSSGFTLLRGAAATSLSITKTHAGNYSSAVGSIQFTVRVTNTGASPTSGPIVVTDTPPTGMNITAMSGSGWSCPTLPVCSRTDALASNAAYPNLTVTATVSASAPLPVVNQVSVAGSGGSATASDTLLITPTLTLQSSPLTTAQLSSPVTLTAQVIPTNAAGTVTFFDGAIPLGTVTVSGGSAQLITGMLQPGARKLRATFSGGAGSVPASATRNFTVTTASQGGVVAGTPISFPGATHVATGDFNGDGKADIAITNNAANNVAIWLGDGAGGFTTAPGSPFATGARPGGVATGDFNRDGKADLAVSSDTGNSVSVLFGNGAGGFTNAPGSPFAAGTSTYYVAVADFNQDGAADIAAANFSSHNVTVLLNNGTGGFTPAPGSPFGGGQNPWTIHVADLNGDGFIDFATPNGFSGDVSVRLGDGAGGFTVAPGSSFQAGFSARSLAIADFTSDGYPDIAVPSFNDGRLDVLTGSATGAMTRLPNPPAIAGPVFAVSTDFNNDGKADVVVTRFVANQLVFLAGDGAGGFTQAYTIGTGQDSGPTSLATADFNRDGRPDYVTANSYGGSITIVLGVGPAAKLAFTTQPPATGNSGSALPAIVVQLQDASGNPVNTAGVTINIASTPAGVTASAVTNASGAATFTGLTPNATGSWTFTASSSGLTSATSTALTVAAGSASAVAFSTPPPSTGSAGQAFSAVVQIRDSFGQLVTGSTASVTLTSAPSGIGGTVTVNAVNGVATLSNLAFAAAGSYTLTATSAGLTPSAGSAITISSGAGSKLAFTVQPPTTRTSGQALNVTVQVQDAAGNPVTTSTAPVTLSSAGGLTGTLTVAAVNGMASFTNIGFVSMGSFSVTAASAGLTSATSTAVSVSAGAAAKLAFSTQPPASGSAGQPQTLAVQVLDVNNNLVSGSTAQIALASTPVGVSGTTTVAAVAGVASFGNVLFAASGNYTLTASSAGLASATSSAIAIGAGTATKLVFSAQPPATRTAGQAFTVSVQVQDSAGNLVTGSAASVAIASTPTGVVGTTPVSATGGVASFNLSLNAAGSYTLTATSAGLTAATSTAVTVSTGASSVALASGSNPSVFSSSTTLTATVTPGTATGTVTFYDGQTPIGTSAVSSGVATFATRLLGAGPHTLRARYNGDSALQPNLSGTVAQVVNAVSASALIPATAISTGQAQQAATGDFNLDGKTDVAIIGLDNRQLTIWLGNGAGGFAPAAGSPYTAGRSTQGLAVADFNGDGKPDLVIANSDDNNVTVWLGNGLGGFTAGTPAAAGTGPSRLAVSDFNGDGLADVVVTNFSTNSVAVLLGNGAGGLAPAPASPFAVGSSPWSVTVGDVNSDGAADILVPNGGSSSVSVLLGNGSGGFSSATPVTVGSSARAVVLADFNGDGKPDMAVPSFNDQNVRIFLGDGAGGFTPASGSPVALGGSAWHALASDFNGDGKMDLAITQFVQNKVSILLGDGAGGFTASATALDSDTGPSAQVTGDFNGDGRVDLLMVNSYGGSVSVLLSAGPATKLGISVSPSYVVRVQDAAGNTVPNSTASVTVTSTPAGVGGTTTVAAVNGVATFSSLTFTPGTYTLTAKSAGLTPADSGSFTIAPPAATKLAITAQPPATRTAGQTFSLTVQVQDATSALVSGSTASVTLSSAPGGLGGTLTVAAVNGVATFSNLAFNATGSYSITAASSGLTSATSTAVAVSAGAATKLVLSTPPPGTGSAGQALSLTIQIQDALNNVVAGSAASVTLSSTPVGLSLSTNAIAGVATFSNVVFNTPGSYTITATSPGLTGVTSGTVVISTGPAAKLAIVSAPPTTLVAGQTFGLAVQVQDVAGNPVTASPVTVSISSTAAGVSGTLSAVTVGGTATLSNLVFPAAGSYTVTAASAGVTSATSGAIAVSLAPQTITFGALAGKSFGAAPFAVVATSDSGLPVSFTSGTPAVCTVTGATVTLVSAGACSLTANQAGDAKFAVAAPVVQGFAVAKATPVITWARPAAITLGGALGGAQLNATANVPGTFVYTPAAGTVLALGTNQTLSVAFTPTDTVRYQNASQTTLIDVVPASTGTGAANLVITTRLARNPDSSVLLTVTITNNGGAAASNVVLVTARVGTTAGTPLPQTVASIAAGASTQLTVNFPATVGTAGAASTLTLSGTYTGGTFTGGGRIVLP